MGPSAAAVFSRRVCLSPGRKFSDRKRNDCGAHNYCNSYYHYTRRHLNNPN